MTVYRLNALIKLAIMIVKLPGVTYEVAFDEPIFSSNFVSTERQFLNYSRQLSPQCSFELAIMTAKLPSMTYKLPSVNYEVAFDDPFFFSQATLVPRRGNFWLGCVS